MAAPSASVQAHFIKIYSYQLVHFLGSDGNTSPSLCGRFIQNNQDDNTSIIWKKLQKSAGIFFVQRKPEGKNIYLSVGTLGWKV